MDQTQLYDLAKYLIITLSPYLAEGALAKVGEDTIDEVKKAWTLITERLRGNKKAEKALSLYEEEPLDEDWQEPVIKQIVACFQENSAAIAELQAVVTALHAMPAHQHTQQINTGDNSRVSQVVQQMATPSGQAQTGSINQGDVGKNVMSPLFAGNPNSVYMADVIHLYQQKTEEKEADYGKALHDYLEHLYTRYAKIDLRGIDDRPMEMPLTDLYISLSLHEPPPDTIRGRQGLRDFLEQTCDHIAQSCAEDADDDDNAEIDTASLTMVGGSKEEAVSWAQALQRNPYLAVVGGPGSGKTTLLHFTTIRLAHILAQADRTTLEELGLAQHGADSHPLGPPVPLLLPLRELGAYLNPDECSKRERMGANPRLLLECLANYYQQFELNLPNDFFFRLCDEGRAMLLLDGLDEVTRSHDREFVSAIVRETVLRFPKCRYVVTSRVAAYHGDAQIGVGFRICTVANLSQEQQRSFIANWSRSLHRHVYEMHGEQLDRESGKYADTFWNALHLNQRVRQLASNPLLLTVVAVIFYNRYQLPEDRASLYEECVEVLLRGGRGKTDPAAQERMTYSGSETFKMGVNQRRELLADVAYRMHQQGEEAQVVQRNELVMMIAESNSLRNKPDPHELAEKFVEELPVHIGLLDEREPNRYRFSHLSFQEFLSARHVAETDKWDELLHHYQESWWREVILLCAGYLSSDRCWRFLGKLLDQGSEVAEQADAVHLAAIALSELERFKGEGPLPAIIQERATQILTLPAHASPAAPRVACGSALAIVGDPREGVCTLPPKMAEIPDGSFVMGSSKEQAEETGKEFEQFYLDRGDTETAKHVRTWTQNEINDRLVYVAGFSLACYPITNAQYALFIEDGGYDEQQPWWDEAARTWLRRDDFATEGLDKYQQRKRKDQPEWWDDKNIGKVKPNHPVVGVSWYEAMAFCRWLSQHTGYNPQGYRYRLPTEAAWEYAARGSQARRYPWGVEAPSGERANYNRLYDYATAVGCFPLGATPEGIYDMAGNVWEWTGTIYKPYPYDATDGREQAENPVKNTFVIRGGGWAALPVSLRASSRNHTPPGSRDVNVGFRLARLPSWEGVC